MRRPAADPTLPLSLINKSGFENNMNDLKFRAV
jgi:hypothetical protein